MSRPFKVRNRRTCCERKAEYQPALALAPHGLHRLRVYRIIPIHRSVTVRSAARAISHRDHQNGGNLYFFVGWRYVSCRLPRPMLPLHSILLLSRCRFAKISTSQNAPHHSLELARSDLLCTIIIRSRAPLCGEAADHVLYSNLVTIPYSRATGATASFKRSSTC